MDYFGPLRTIAKAEPLKKSGCSRGDCFPCTTGGGNCERNGAGYNISCLRCRRVVKEEVEYEGESGSNGYSRGGEHLTALDLKQEDNALWKHCLVAHRERKLNFP